MTAQPRIGNHTRVAVVGLGYVGLPLAMAFAGRYDTVGFDTKAVRVSDLKSGLDVTREVDAAQLRERPRLALTSDGADIASCNVFVIAVPTPIDDYKRPDLTALLAASRTVGGCLKPGDVVVYESTVYPGATEEQCVPVLEAISGLAFNLDFFVGYSPERANPGDRLHTLATVVKLTSGSTAQTADFVDALYGSIVPAGTHKTSSIRVAEAAKVIENTQRDLNIALVNEFAIIFNRLGLNTAEVLAAAATKWNFLPFRPGLVGGHCIGVDPYYLTYKAEAVGYHPEVILSGRRINDGMGVYVANQLIKCMVKRRVHVAGSRILLLGITFKENCPDIRNTRVIDIVRELESFEALVDVHDPWAPPDELRHEFGLEPKETPDAGAYDAIIFAVAHEQFKTLSPETLAGWGKADPVIYDLKGVLPLAASTLRL